MVKKLTPNHVPDDKFDRVVNSRLLSDRLPIHQKLYIIEKVDIFDKKPDWKDEPFLSFLTKPIMENYSMMDYVTRPQWKPETIICHVGFQWSDFLRLPVIIYNEILTTDEYEFRCLRIAERQEQLGYGQHGFSL